MQFRAILSLLAFLVPCIVGTPWPVRIENRTTSTKNCLSTKDVTSILSMWSELKIGNLSKINKVVAKGFKGTDNDVNNGTGTPFVEGRDAYKQYLTTLHDPTQNDAIGVNETTIFSFHSCNRIAYRWHRVEYSTGVGVNKLVTFIYRSLRQAFIEANL